MNFQPMLRDSFVIFPASDEVERGQCKLLPKRRFGSIVSLTQKWRDQSPGRAIKDQTHYG